MINEVTRIPIITPGTVTNRVLVCKNGECKEETEGSIGEKIAGFFEHNLGWRIGSDGSLYIGGIPTKEAAKAGATAAFGCGYEAEEVRPEPPSPDAGPKATISTPEGPMTPEQLDGGKIIVAPPPYNLGTDAGVVDGGTCEADILAISYAQKDFTLDPEGGLVQEAFLLDDIHLQSLRTNDLDPEKTYSIALQTDNHKVTYTVGEETRNFSTDEYAGICLDGALPVALNPDGTFIMNPFNAGHRRPLKALYIKMVDTLHYSDGPFEKILVPGVDEDLTIDGLKNLLKNNNSIDGLRGMLPDQLNIGDKSCDPTSCTPGSAGLPINLTLPQDFYRDGRLYTDVYIGTIFEVCPPNPESTDAGVVYECTPDDLPDFKFSTYVNAMVLGMSCF